MVDALSDVRATLPPSRAAHGRPTAFGLFLPSHLERRADSSPHAANTALELAGEREQIDCRSYADQDKDKPEHARRIPQIHLGVTTKVMERKGVVTPRLERWEAIEAERAQRRKEMEARQAAARAAQQRAHIEVLRGRMKPEQRPEGADDVARDASPFDADTVESPPPAVEVSSEAGAAEEDDMTHEELLEWEAEHHTSDYDMVAQALERDAQGYLAQAEREQAYLEEIQERVADRLRVRRLTTHEPATGLYIDRDPAVCGRRTFAFVQTADDELVAFYAPRDHEAMRGQQVDVRFNTSSLEVTPLQREQEPAKTSGEELTVREYKQFLANVSQKTVVSLSCRPVFEGRMLGEHEVAGETIVLVENEREILVTPSTPSLKARYNKDVVVYAERGPEGGLRARAKSKSRGMGR